MIPESLAVPESWLALLAAAAVKGSLLVAAGGAVAAGLRRGSAAIRHAVWTAVIAAVLLVAPLGALLPALRIASGWLPPEPAMRRPLSGVVRVGVPAAQLGTVPPPGSPLKAANPGGPAPSAPSYFPAALLGIWASGALVLASCFVVAGVRLGRMAQHSAAAPEPELNRLAAIAANRLGVAPERVHLRWSCREATPMTWGWRHPMVLLPVLCRSWDEERLSQALVHEIGHIRRWDVVTQALGNAACALYWFNPLVWLAARKMLVERERACDDLVLESGALPSAYAHGLLEMARSLGAGWTAARVSPAMARRSQISGRLLAVLDPDRSRRAIGRREVITAALGCVLVVAPLAMVRPARAIPSPVSGEQVGAGAAALAATPQGTNAPATALEDFKAIGAVYGEWKNAVVRRDAHAIGELYTADATLVTQDRPEVTGRQAITQLYQSYLDFGLATIEVNPREMYTVGAMICELGTSDALTASGHVLSRSRYMTLWKKEDGKWRVHRDFLAQ